MRCICQQKVADSGDQRGLQNDCGLGESCQDENENKHRGGYPKPSTGMVGSRK